MNALLIAVICLVPLVSVIISACVLSSTISRDEAAERAKREAQL